MNTLIPVLNKFSLEKLWQWLKNWSLPLLGEEDEEVQARELQDILTEA